MAECSPKGRSKIPTDPIIRSRWVDIIRKSRGEEFWKPSKTTNTPASKEEPSSSVTCPNVVCTDTLSEINEEFSDIDSIFDTPKKAKLRRELRRKICIQKKHSLKIQSLRRKNVRLKKKIASFKDILVKLKKERYIDNDTHNVLNSNVFAADLYATMEKKLKKKSKRPVSKYRPEFRKFCLTLHFLSPNAYRFVRSKFETCLPHPKTISKWYANIDGSPGFTEDSFKILDAKRKQSDKNMTCALIADEMAIRQQKCFNEKTKQDEGLVDIGTGPNENMRIKASEAYVFLLVSLNEPWKLPVAYFLVHGMTGDQKANIIKSNQMILNLYLKVSRKRTYTEHETRKIISLKSYTPVLKSNSFTGFLGVLICINSLKVLYATVIESHKMQYLSTYRNSQDHIELLFGAIRMHGGYNDNPNARQLKGIYRKLLCHMELKSAGSGNCVPLENISVLTCSSALKCINLTTPATRKDDEDESEMAEEHISDENGGSVSRFLDDSSLYEYTQQIVGYISGCVVRCLRRQIKCTACIECLFSNEKHEYHKLVSARDEGGLIYASRDVYSVFETEHACGSLHQVNLIRLVAEKYLTIRCYHIAKLDNVKSDATSKRKLFKKQIQREGH
ncbi:unnamed protein product [Colias eurytheme]|nr:unnamed protein product [Colias eurytheme]